MLFVKIFYAETERELNKEIMEFLTEVLENPLEEYKNHAYEKCYRKMENIRIYPHTSSNGTLKGYSAVLQYKYDSANASWMKAVKVFGEVNKKG